MNSFLDFDRDLLLGLNGLSGRSWLDSFMLLVSAHWPWALLALVYVAWALKKRNVLKIKEFIWIAGTMIICDVVAAQGFKPWLARLRPCKVDGLVHIVDGCAGLYGLPSNHASNAAVFATMWFFLYGARQGFLAFSVAILVAVSRVYLGVHYPSDVLAGMAFGMILGALSIRFYRALSRSQAS